MTDSSREGASKNSFLPSASLDVLRIRAECLRRIRAFFDDRGFLEVETPVLSFDTVVDRHLDPIPVTLFDDPRSPHVGARMWLQTSPEFCMKRLLAAGAQAIYQISKVFRGAERGPWHNPEFTMVEWYRVGDDLTAGMQILAELTNSMRISKSPCEKISYRHACERITGLNPLQATIGEISTAIRQAGAIIPSTMPNDDRDTWLDLLMSEVIAPRLGNEAPVILYDFPPSQAALARVRDGEFPVAERFELFVQGIELANGYHELLDAKVLRQRQSRANQERQRDGKYVLPEENRLLLAMQQGLPPSADVALGFDRLVMVTAGAKSIAEVLAFPTEIA